MNDDVLTQLKVHVEKAVRPLRISLLRKKRMREDLLAHIIEIYDDETANADDEQEILQRTFERFGEPSEITAEMRKGVSLMEGISWLIEFGRIRPGENYLSVLWRHLLAGVVWVLLVLPLPLFEFWNDGQTAELLTALRVIGTVMGVMTIVSSLCLWFSHHYCLTQYGVDQNQTRSKGHFVWLSVLILPLMMLMVYGALGFSSPPSYMMIASLVLAPVIPICLMITAKSAAEMINHEFDWARLQIED